MKYPNYVRMGEGGSCLCLSSKDDTHAFYYRHAGMWTIRAKKSWFKLCTDDPDFPNESLRRNVRLIKVSKEEWEKDNAGYCTDQYQLQFKKEQEVEDDWDDIPF